MRLVSLTVSGWGGFAAPVHFGPLEEFNVLYGPSSAGKSSLLSALELYFRILAAGEAVSQFQPQILDEPEPELAHLLERGSAGGVRLEAEWQLPEAALEAAGLFPEEPCGRIETAFEVRTVNRAHEIRVKKWTMGERDFAVLERGEQAKALQFAGQVRRLLSDAKPFQFEKPVLPFARLGESPERFPQALRDRLFDARQSLAPASRRRWNLFARLAAGFEAELGPGSWETTFDRASGRADLIYLQENVALPLERMSAGVQRLAGLLAELCLAEEGWVVIEEPECRLSPDLQRRFAAMARRVLETGLGPKQLFVTSHSPILAAEGTAFLLRREEGQPVLERRPWSDSSPGETQREPTLGALIGKIEELAAIEPEALLSSLSGGAPHSG